MGCWKMLLVTGCWLPVSRYDHQIFTVSAQTRSALNPVPSIICDVLPRQPGQFCKVYRSDVLSPGF